MNIIVPQICISYSFPVMIPRHWAGRARASEQTYHTIMVRILPCGTPNRPYTGKMDKVFFINDGANVYMGRIERLFYAM